MVNALLRTLIPFAVPVALLVAAFALVIASAALPPSLAGLKVWGPYLLFVLGAVMAVAFNRGRALLALVVLASAYGAQQLWLQQGLEAQAARVVYAGLTVLVPLNLAALSLLRERGIFGRAGVLRLAAIGAQALLIAWSAAAGSTVLFDWVYHPLLVPPPFSAGHIPQIGMVAISLGLLVTMAAACLAPTAIHGALAGGIVAFAVGTHVPTASVAFSVFTAAAELMLTIAVLQDTFRMAFRDELTALPSRRALNERLMALGRTYSIAMIDVDHFKKFNDTYGHDLGDQVLKMVAARIHRVSGGGKAFRYGGEEFTVLFPGRSLEEALPHLEALRASIEAYRLALRDADRPRKAKGAKRQRGGWRAKDTVSVTVSIGVAERNDKLATPQSVIEAADRALYRAKEKGRNRVSR